MTGAKVSSGASVSLLGHGPQFWRDEEGEDPGVFKRQQGEKIGFY